MTILSCASLKRFWKMCGWHIWDTPATNVKSEWQKCDQQCSGEGSVLGSGYIIISFHEMGFSSVGIWSHRVSPCQIVALLLRSQVSLYSNAECQLYHSKQRCGDKFGKIYNKFLKIFPALLVEGSGTSGERKMESCINCVVHDHLQFVEISITA